MSCITSVAAYLGGRLLDAVGDSVQREAVAGASSLGGWASRALWNNFQGWRNKVERVPTRTATVVGAEGTLRDIRSHLSGDQVDVVGVVGMGGVGKTTLLVEINNDLYSGGACKFDIVIFATVSRDGDVLKVRKQIGRRLGLPELSEGVAHNWDALHDSLSNKRYLLLLDDVWGDLDLLEIGIPLPSKLNGCKVVLTCRSRDVFGRFLGTWCQRRQRARTVRVRPLDKARSWELFCGMLDAEVDLHDPSIKQHARRLVQKCGGLPLALVVVGRAMAAATSPALWRKAAAQLEELEGMDAVYSSLKFSIDRLEEQRVLPCFLYCSLFPEDYSIPVEKLVECWIGEGFLDVGDEPAHHLRQGVEGTICRARDEGHIVIERLKDLCLLETSFSEEHHICVKMHDLVRDMALKLSSKEPSRFLVPTSECPPEGGARPAMKVYGWEEATRVSLMNCLIDEGSLPEMPSCPRASTLLMHNLTLPRELPDGFFTFMPGLVVLDLSRANFVTNYSDVYLRCFPASICLLSELRYLNLSWTDIRSLPIELGNLLKLRQLDVSDTYSLATIPHRAISRLSNLQVLNMRQCIYRWADCGDGSGASVVGTDDRDRPLFLSDLHGLKQLQDITIDVRSLDLLGNGRSLLRSITQLGLVGISDLTTDTLLSALRSIPSLRGLQVRECENLCGELVLDGNVDAPVLRQLELLVLWRLPLSAIVIRGGDEEDEGDAQMTALPLPFGGRREAGVNGLPLQKLRFLYISSCTALKDLRWVAQLHLLEVIDVSSCNWMSRLLSHGTDQTTRHGSGGGGGGGSGQWTFPLPKLRSMKLTHLPKLRSICDPPQFLPSLEYLCVVRCPLLGTLPLGPDSKIKRIEGDQDWWEGVQWGRDQHGIQGQLSARFFVTHVVMPFLPPGSTASQGSTPTSLTERKSLGGTSQESTVINL